MNRAARMSAISRLLRLTLFPFLVVTCLPAPALGEPPPQRFAVYDTDSDGYLSQREYLVLVELRRQHGQRRGRMAQQPAPAFAKIDRDCDGRIGQQDLTDMLRGAGGD